MTVYDTSIKRNMYPIENINKDIKLLLSIIIDHTTISFHELSQIETLHIVMKICKDTLQEIIPIDDKIQAIIQRECELELNRLKTLDRIVYLSVVNRETHTINMSKNKLSTISKQLEYLQNLPQYEQKSPEWFAHRQSMITASDLALAIGKSKYQSNLKNLILRKCGVKVPFISSRATKHGIKYEDVAIMLYEKRNNVIIDEYGCIKHKDIPYIGASPDGICSIKSKNKNLIGRMLEIKCPYTRKITGIPPLGYTIQVQGQLEVCDLEYCDFLECKISEYHSLDKYLEDKITEDKGVVIETYNTNIQRASFFYSSININAEDYQKWNENKLDMICESSHLEYISTTYWKLELYSCVLMKRNRDWFHEILPLIKNFWDKVLYHRKNGHEELSTKIKYKKSHSQIPTFGFYEDDNDNDNDKNNSQSSSHGTHAKNITKDNKIKVKGKKKKKKVTNKTKDKKKKKTNTDGSPKEIFIHF